MWKFSFNLIKLSRLRLLALQTLTKSLIITRNSNKKPTNLSSVVQLLSSLLKYSWRMERPTHLEVLFWWNLRKNRPDQHSKGILKSNIQIKGNKTGRKNSLFNLIFRKTNNFIVNSHWDRLFKDMHLLPKLSLF